MTSLNPSDPFRSSSGPRNRPSQYLAAIFALFLFVSTGSTASGQALTSDAKGNADEPEGRLVVTEQFSDSGAPLITDPSTNMHNAKIIYIRDRKSTRLNSTHPVLSYAVSS